MAARWRILAGIVWALLSICCEPALATPPPVTLTPTLVLAPSTPSIVAEPSAAPTPSVVPSPPPLLQATATPTAALPPPLRMALERARSDLAARLKTPLDEVLLERIVSDEFPAGNLGCPPEGATPTPGAMPALVSGWQLTLRVGEATYAYRARASELVYCGPR